jgi:ribonuclease P protein component
MNESQKIKTLKENHLFSKAYRKGRCFSGKYIALYVMKDYNKGAKRLGITVSKSRGNAVVRNRTKRIIREAYRVFHPFIKEGHIIVIVARQPSVGAHLSVVTSELEGLLEKAALL